MDLGPLSAHAGDALVRKRQVEQRRSAPHEAATAHQSANEQSDRLERSDIDVQRYVDQLKTMQPEDVHRLEDLRQRIADGSYSSDLDDLIDPLLEFLGEEPPTSDA